MKTRFIVILALASTPICWAVQVTGDSANVGSGNTVPSASNSAAVGTNNIVGNGSLASGSYNSIGELSFASGEWNVSNGLFTSAIGSGNSIDWMTGSLGSQSAGSSVFGNWNGIQNSEGSVTAGTGNGIYGESGSFIAGTWNVIWSDQVNSGNAGNYGWSNVVLGNSNAINKTTNSISDSVLIGLGNSTEVSQSWIFGEGNIGQTGTVTLGTYAATVSNASLIVGTGTGGSPTPRANGLVVLKNGTVSIPSGVLQLGSDTAVTTGYLSTNKYLQQTTPGATVSSGGIAAWGWGAQATAAHTLALGEGSAATAAGSLSIGVQAHATNVSSVAIGPFTTATGFGSLAMQGGLAEGYCSTAIGRYNHAKGADSFAIGYESLTGVDAIASLAVGANTIASSLGSAAVGFHAESSGFTSSAFGAYANAAQRDSTAIGFATKTVSLASIAIGSCNVGTAGNSGWNWIETDPIFELGNGYNGVRSNAISTLKNGRSTLINKFWSASAPLADPSSTVDSGGEALVVDGHTRLRGKVVIEQPQGDISMGIYGN